MLASFVVHATRGVPIRAGGIGDRLLSSGSAAAAAEELLQTVAAARQHNPLATLALLLAFVLFLLVAKLCIAHGPLQLRGPAVGGVPCKQESAREPQGLGQGLGLGPGLGVGPATEFELD